MSQFNLLPDVKLEYLRAERLRRLVISVSVVATIVAVAILVLSFMVTLFQKKHLSDLNNDITTARQQIEGHDDLNKILTVQSQLNRLTELHDGKPAASRLGDYLNQVTPTAAHINTLDVDFGGHTLSITGTADSLATINRFVDTLKFTTYTATPAPTPGATPAANGGNTANKTPQSQDAFSDVVLDSISVTEHEMDYTIKLSYDPAIFDVTQAVALNVPDKVTTRSDLFVLPIDKPTDGTTPTKTQGSSGR